MTTFVAFFATASLFVQDKPQDIAKKDLPKKAECVVCTASGEAHGEEKPAAGVMYKGKAYYFCNAKEVDGFKKDPEGYVPPVLPMPAPKFNLKDLSGVVWNNDSFKGKVVLLDFWATWCKPCKEIKPRIEKVYETYKEKNFTVLSVSIDDKLETLTKHVAKDKFANPVVWDNAQAFADWRVKFVPTLFLVKDGQVIARWVGKPAKDDLEKAVQTAVNP